MDKLLTDKGLRTIDYITVWHQQEMQLTLVILQQ